MGCQSSKSAAPLKQKLLDSRERILSDDNDKLDDLKNAHSPVMETASTTSTASPGSSTSFLSSTNEEDAGVDGSMEVEGGDDEGLPTRPTSNTRRDEFPSGDVFEGEYIFVDHPPRYLKHGKGDYKYSDGSYFVGTYVRDRMVSGMFYLAGEKTLYEGSFKDNYYHGQGTMTYETPLVLQNSILMANHLISQGHDEHAVLISYQGNFALGQKNGKGKLVFKDGRTIEGYFRDDVLLATINNKEAVITAIEQGQADQYLAIETLAGGTETYVGYFNKQYQRHSHYLPQGTATPSYRDGSTLCRLSQVTYANHDILSTYYENGKMIGEAQIKYTLSGDVYTGKVNAQGMKHGNNGVYTFSNGDVFLGKYFNDHKSGYGHFSATNGSQYTGNYVNNLFEGEGNFTWSDGSSYSGSWLAGQRHGFGTQVYKSGAKYTGMWQADKKHGEGEAVLKDGSKYIGSYYENKRHGNGTLVKVDGSKEKMIYEMGEFLRHRTFWGKITGT
jgi:hypothetical protein